MRKEKTLFLCVVNTVGLHKAESQEIRAGHVTPMLPPRLPLLLHSLLTERIWAPLLAWANKPWQVYQPTSWKAISWNLPGWNWGVFQWWWIKTVLSHIHEKNKTSKSQSTVLISCEWQKWQKRASTSLNRAIFPEQKLQYSIDWWLISIQAVPSFVLSVTDLGFPPLNTSQNNQRDLLHTLSHETWTDNWLHYIDGIKHFRGILF